MAAHPGDGGAITLQVPLGLLLRLSQDQPMLYDDTHAADGGDSAKAVRQTVVAFLEEHVVRGPRDLSGDEEHDDDTDGAAEPRPDPRHEAFVRRQQQGRRPRS